MTEAETTRLDLRGAVDAGSAPRPAVRTASATLGAGGEGDRVEVRRAGLLETAHAVSLAVCDPDGRLVASAGDPGERTFWRSAAKPFQLLPFLVSGGAAAYGFGAREVAVMAASHNAEAPHRAVVAAILRAAGFAEADLLCGAHLPEAEVAWRELAATGGPPTALWNNCSGKHAGMLAHCRHRGWAPYDYRRPDHPLQREVLAVVVRATGEEAGAIRLGIDGCGVPALHLPLSAMARAYAGLADPEALPEGWRAAAREIVDAVAAEPFYVAGTGRPCTRLAETAGDRVVAKVGAGGVFCAALRGRGWGLALKVRDGSSRAAAAALLEALRQLGALDESDIERLAELGPGPLRNHAGAEVGEIAVDLRLAVGRRA